MRIHPLIQTSLFLLATSITAFAQGTAFTYQGRLNDNGVAADGSYDLRFILYTADVDGGQVGPVLTNSAVAVSNGLFTVTLDFGADMFSGANRWLQIGVRSNGTVIDFVTLRPRQELTPTPYAIYAGGASAAGLRGTILSNNIAAGSITSTMLATGSVTGVQLAHGSVNTSNLVSGAVTADKVFAVTQAVSMLTITNPFPARADYFGLSVAGLGADRVLIGAPGNDRGVTNSGAAYLFNVSGNLLTTFTNPTPTLDESLGNSVAAMGTDRVLIGAPFAGTAPIWSGVAYLFSSDGTLLTTFTNPTPAESDLFGSSMTAVGTDKVLIGKAYGDDGATNSGVAYLFRTDGALLTTFTNPTPASFDYFGYSLAAVGTDRALFGAPYASRGATGAGVAYLFSNTGPLLTVITNPTPQFYDGFGISLVAIGADRVLIGASGDSTGAPGAGAAYLFRTDGALLVTITNPAPSNYEGFGHSVAALGSDRLLIGEGYTGNAHVFDTNGALLLTIPNQVPYGVGAVPVGSDRVLIGGPYEDTGAPDAGAAYLFTLGAVAPGLFAAGVGPETITTVNLANGAVTASKLDPSIGLWRASGSDVVRDSGNVGIGTSTPAQKLHVGGRFLRVDGGNNEQAYLGADGLGSDVQLGSFNPAINNVALYNANSGAYMNLFASNLVGIGVLTLNSGGDAAIFTGSGFSELNRYLTLLNSPTFASASGLKAGGVLVSDSYAFANPGKNDLIVKGRVGIGTDSPHHRLRISGGPTWTSAGWQGALELDNAAAIGWNANAAGNRFGIGQSGGGLYFFHTTSDPGTATNGPNYVLTISDSGNVGIGLGFIPSFQLQLWSDSAGKPNGGSWANSSDARVKKNIQPLTGALDKLTQLRGVSFEWVNPADHANQTGRQAGFVAQEVERVFPNWIQEVPGAERDAALTPNGRVKSLSLPFEFDALTVEALRELREENAELKRKLQELKANDAEIQHLKVRLAALENFLTDFNRKDN